MDVTVPVPASAVVEKPAIVRVSPEKLKAFEMFGRGASVEDVSQATGRARSTISDYLADFVLAEKPASIGAWVPDSMYKQVVNAKMQINTDRLKPLFLALGE